MDYTLKFIIRKDRLNKTGSAPLYLRYTCDRKSLNIPLQISISPTLWDDVLGCPITRYKGRKNIEESMQKLEKNVKKRIQTFLNNSNHIPSCIELRDLLNEIGRIDNEEITIHEAFNKYLSSKEGLVSKSTIGIYKVTFKLLEEFFMERNQIISWHKFDSDFENNFKRFCFSRGYAKNTIGKYIKQIKAFLKFSSTKFKVVNPEQYEHLKIDSEKFEVIAFTESELLQLKNSLIYLDASTKESIKKSRERWTKRELLVIKILIFLCRTALRFSDFNRLTVNNFYWEIQSDGIIKMCLKIVPDKTRQNVPVIIPLHNDVMDILFLECQIPISVGPFWLWSPEIQQKIKSFKKMLEMYRDNPPKRKKVFEPFPEYPRLFPQISNPAFNREVKEVCKKIGIDNMVMVTKTKGGKVVSENYKKYQLVTSHIGRKTFTSLSVKAGVPTQYIQKVTGHTDQRSMKPYINISQNDIVDEFENKFK